MAIDDGTENFKRIKEADAGPCTPNGLSNRFHPPGAGQKLLSRVYLSFAFGPFQFGVGRRDSRYFDSISPFIFCFYLSSILLGWTSFSPNQGEVDV